MVSIWSWKFYLNLLLDEMDLEYICYWNDKGFLGKVYDRICMLTAVDVSLGVTCLDDFVVTHKMIHSCFQGHSTGWFLLVFRVTLRKSHLSVISTCLSWIRWLLTCFHIKYLLILCLFCNNYLRILKVSNLHMHNHICVHCPMWALVMLSLIELHKLTMLPSSPF